MTCRTCVSSSFFNYPTSVPWQAAWVRSKDTQQFEERVASDWAAHDGIDKGGKTLRWQGASRPEVLPAVIPVADDQAAIDRLPHGMGCLLPRPDAERDTLFPLHAVAGVSAAVGINQLLGTLWYEPRPFATGLGRTLIQHAPDNSFPSDHVALCDGGLRQGGTMAGFVSLDGLFAGRHFDREIIILCVRWYLRFKLSFRDLVEMMAERGLPLGRAILSPVSCFCPGSALWPPPDGV
jgi:hypothetical protein